MSVFDTDLPIITRARDMRPVAYVESVSVALEFVIEHAVETGTEDVENDASIRKAQAYIIDLASALEAYESGTGDADDMSGEYLHEYLADAEDLVNDMTPEPWYFMSDEDDPSYGGFYRLTNDDEDA